MARDHLGRIEGHTVLALIHLGDRDPSNAATSHIHQLQKNTPRRVNKLSRAATPYRAIRPGSAISTGFGRLTGLNPVPDAPLLPLGASDQP
jgi:hypothetical protein